jgi:hypothetical protein
VSPFFGLSSDYREQLLEEVFILNQRMNMSYLDVMQMPIRFRRWFIDRLIKASQPKTNSAMDDMDTPLKKSMMIDK